MERKISTNRRGLHDDFTGLQLSDTLQVISRTETLSSFCWMVSCSECNAKFRVPHASIVNNVTVRCPLVARHGVQSPTSRDYNVPQQQRPYTPGSARQQAAARAERELLARLAEEEKQNG